MFEGSKSPSSRTNFSFCWRILSNWARIWIIGIPIGCSFAPLHFFSVIGWSSLPSQVCQGLQREAVEWCQFYICRSLYPWTPHSVSSTKHSITSITLSTNPRTTADALSTGTSLPVSVVGLFLNEFVRGEGHVLQVAEALRSQPSTPCSCHQ